MPRGASPKRERQYKHIKQSAKRSGRYGGRAEEVAARTVNKIRREKGETESGARGSRTKSRAGGSRTKSRAGGSPTKSRPRGSRTKSRAGRPPTKARPPGSRT